jgi:copper resistance protein D
VPWVFILWVHVSAAVVWIGGMAMVALVIAPVLAPRDASSRPSPDHAELLRAMGERFSQVSWVCIVVLVMTGILNLVHLAIPWDVLFTTRFGELLIVKWCFVAGMIGLSSYHDFIAGPRLRLLSPQDPVYVRLAARMRWSGRVNLVLGLAVLFFAIGLRRL